MLVSERGAYGMRLPALPGQELLCSAVPGDWCEWTFAISDTTPLTRPQQIVGPDTAVLWTKPDGYVEVSREKATTTIFQRDVPPRPAFVHPLLGSTAVAHAEWHGWLSFHGGCVIDNRNRAWAVLGERKAGKSSTLAWFAAHGAGVHADDLVITDGDMVFAGPRCIDLRESAARQFGIGVDLGVIGTRRRWRVQLPDSAASLPLAGWVSLQWGNEVSVNRLDTSDLSRVLTANRALLVGQQHPIPWLSAMTKPMLHVTRGKNWSSAETSLLQLRDRMNTEGRFL